MIIDDFDKKGLNFYLRSFKNLNKIVAELLNQKEKVSTKLLKPFPVAVTASGFKPETF